MLALCMIFWCDLRAADEVSLHERIQAARVLISDREFNASIRHLLPTLAKARQDGANPNTIGEILNDLGYSYRMLGQCNDAIGALTTSVELIRSSPGRQISAINLAASLLECGQARRAEGLWRTLLAPLATTSPDVAGAPLWAAGATIQAFRGHYAISEALYTEAITGWQQAASDDSVRLALARIGRGVVLAYLGRLREASEDAVEWPAIQDAPASTRAAALANIALVHFLAGRLKDAHALFEKALASLGPSPGCPCAATIWANYAALLHRMGDARASKAATLRARAFAGSSGAETIDARVMPWKLRGDIRH